MEDLFDYENIYDEIKVKLALFKPNEYALHWWELIQSYRIQ